MASRVRQRKHYQGSIASAMPGLLDTIDNGDDGDTLSSLSVNDDARTLSLPATTTHRSPYLHPTHQATASTSTFNAHPNPPPTVVPTASSSSQTPTTPGTPRISASRKPSSLRHVANAAPSESTQSVKRRPSPSGREGKSTRSGREQKIRTTPRLPHGNDVPIAPATTMYWSRAPVYGALPMHNMRAHTVTLVDNVAWLFGGCDEKGCWKDVYCFDTETMQWSHPEMLGDIPPPCRAHTATLVDRKIVVFGGGEGPVYYDTTYILDTTTRRWYAPAFPAQSQPQKNASKQQSSNPPPAPDPVHPAPRRAHTAVLYMGKIYIFGGGNGLTALNDLWVLDVSRLDTSMRSGSSGSGLKWSLIETSGDPPAPRGYHTANLIGNVMVIVGGSDGKECFSDVWCLNLDSLVWTRVSLSVSHRRLSHTSTQVGSYLFIVGGHDGNSYSSEILLYNLVNLQYEPRAVCGTPPSPRGYHVTVVADSRLFLFGGFNGHDVFDDVYILDLAGAAYLPQVMSFRIDV
ncbi:hypothetical protein SCLCIDRAFT_1212266 [Scleroderma citrinum Foug A]|uniref:Galactose oxidase n=1 Tax=Scleroderma citrinum Foug A TaxID=1036808 RepID=A0A0C3EC74_9AGAM|nr:hypothetical protein SCLCIDRAFT_1212266 [Scleroderma citrinum Foug A]